MIDRPSTATIGSGGDVGASTEPGGMTGVPRDAQSIRRTLEAVREAATTRKLAEGITQKTDGVEITRMDSQTPRPTLVWCPAASIGTSLMWYPVDIN